MDTRRKPRLPDRLVAELRENKDKLGKSPKEKRKRQSNEHSPSLTRKQRRKEKRLEKKRRILQHRNRRRGTERAPSQIQPSSSEARRPADEKQISNPAIRLQQTPHKCPSDGDLRKQELQEAIDKETRELRRLAKKAGLPAEETAPCPSIDLDGFLHGLAGDFMEGIPKEEIHSNERDEGSDANGSLSMELSEELGEERHVTSESSDDEIPQLVAMEDGTVSRKNDNPVNETGVYVPPAMRSSKQTETDVLVERESVTRRRVRGLINRLAEENIKGIANEIVALYKETGHAFVTNALRFVAQALSTGPRATRQFTGIAAAVVSAVSTLANAHDITSSFFSRAAAQLEMCYKESNMLGTYNCMGLFCHLYLTGVMSSRILYGLLHRCLSHFQDMDIGMIYRLLESCGLRLRSDDPEMMKQFVTDVHNKAAALSRQGILGKKTELMLDLVIDIKNNKLSKTGRRESFVHLSHSVGKWLQQIDVPRMVLEHLTWDQLLSPNKRGQWWLPDPSIKQDRLVSTLHLENQLQEEGAELLTLATQQRMNTDVRKAAFCVIMGSLNVNDACAKLIALPLKGDQDRDIIRVLVHCCLQEKRWNPFYGALAEKLSLVKKSHGVTLKFSILDRLQMLDEMDVGSLDHLAKLMAYLIQKMTISISILKVVDLPMTLVEKRVFFWRIFFVQWLLGYDDVEAIVEAVEKLSHSESLILLGKKLFVFLKLQLGPWIKKSHSTSWLLAEKRTKLLLHFKTVISKLKIYKAL